MSKSKTMKDTQGNQRINFASAKGVEVPDFLDIQVESFKEFFQLDTLPEDRKKEARIHTRPTKANPAARPSITSEP